MRVIADGWKDYEIIATGCGEKLERIAGIVLLRPDPQVIWPAQTDLAANKQINAVYKRSDKGGGGWQFNKKTPDEWTIGYKQLKFSLKLMGFKHVGLFPEQAANWDKMTLLIKSAKANNNKEINVLNLFAYTGGATVACAAAGAKVTHVDAARGMVDRAKKNATLSNIPDDRIRYIVDDCAKFVAREIKRGVKYDAVIMDPPSYGRGPNGEMWRVEDNLFDLVKLTTEVLKPDPLFFLINSYTTGLQPTVIQNILNLCLKDFRGRAEGYELCLPTHEDVLLPCGCSGLWTGEGHMTDKDTDKDTKKAKADKEGKRGI